MEAISLLSPGRGLRRADKDMLAYCKGGHPSRAWAIYAEIDGPQGRASVGTARETGGDKTARTVKIDGQHVPQSELPHYLGVSWLTPRNGRAVYR